MAWITNTYKISSAVASILGLGAGTRPPDHWNEPIWAGLEFAKGVIRRALAVRGFRPDQIEAWDDLESYHRRITLCNVFREGGIGKGYDTIHLGEYCKAVGELANVPVTINGVNVNPNTNVGGAVSGDFDFAREIVRPGEFPPGDHWR